MIKRLAYTACLGAVLLPVGAVSNDSVDDLGNLSLESLGNIVTSVSKKPEDSFRSPAAIYVITNEDIKLSGATHIAEVLRGVPGLDVARFDSSNWAIASRGSNGFFTNKLLVLVDGRTIYTPLFSGVYWDIQNLVLADVKRIEIIRGPGASLWGSNAVNGIINIITKNAAETQGAYASQVVGTWDRSLSDLRYGGKLGESAYYRVYAKYDDREATNAQGGSSGDNAWNNAKTGFRTDWDVSSTRKITLQGDVYSADINLNLYNPSLTSISGIDIIHDHILSHGANILGRWEEKHSDTLQSTFQLYTDYQSPNYSALGQQIFTYDADYQTAWKANGRNDVVWGAGARYIVADLTPSQQIGVQDTGESQNIFNTFIQDQYALVPKEFFVTLGSKFEYNSFVGFVPEPSIRFSWYPDDKQTVWASVSRAVRTPGITEVKGMSLNVLALSPFMVQERSNSDFESEELVAYEAGYRVKPVKDISLDNTVFYNNYQNLSTLEPGAPIGNVLPYFFENLGKAHSFGFETSATWDVTSRWKLLANYSYINLIMEQAPDSLDPTFSTQNGLVPHNQFMIRSQWFMPHDTQLINTAYYVDQLPASSVDSYLRFDTQVIWQAMNGVELSLVGQNLLDRQHEEFGAAPNGVVNEIPRAYYARLTLRY